MRLLVLVVLYRRPCTASETLRTLAACREFLEDSLVVVWDNSPDPQHEDNMRWLSQALPRVSYTHDAANPGLSQVYNRIIHRYLKPETMDRFDYLLLLDHDSRLTNNFFVQLEQASRQYPMIGLFLPLVTAHGRIVSPSNLYGCKGVRWNKPRIGLLRSRHRTAINSGMAISATYLRETFSGYDDRLRFYGTDNFFMREYGRTNPYFVVLNCTIQHDLSFFTPETLEIKLWRHRESVAALLLLNEGRGITAWLTRAYCRICDLRQAFKYRDLRFLA